MGKASKAKKHRNKLGNASAPTITYQGKEVDTNSLHSDLESIYENKRRDGCELLMGIISSCSGDVVVKLASAPLLNILSLRLLDTSAVVRGYAAQIISSMAVCKNSSVANTIVSSGTILLPPLLLHTKWLLLPNTMDSTPFSNFFRLLSRHANPLCRAKQRRIFR